MIRDRGAATAALASPHHRTATIGPPRVPSLALIGGDAGLLGADWSLNQCHSWNKSGAEWEHQDVNLMPNIKCN